MTLNKVLLLAGLGWGLIAAPPARAQDHTLHYVQAGALLTYAQAETRILYAVVSAREFDPKLTKDIIQELRRTVGDAKRRVDRSATLLPEKLAAYEPKIMKLRDAVRQAEDQLTKLANDVDEQTKSLTEEEETELGIQEVEDEGGPPQVDWDLLKKGVSWLAKDINDARSDYFRLAKKLKLPSLRSPPKARGKRPD